MDQLTVRGFGDDLGAGLAVGGEATNAVGSSLDHLFGTWTAEEADQFDAVLEDFESIDKSAWA